MRMWEALCAYLQGFLSWLINRPDPPAATRLGALDGMRDDRESLRKLLNRVGAMLRDAEQMEIRREGTRLWLRELKDLADDTEDVLDDFMYEELRCKVVLDQGGNTPHGRSASDSSSSSSSSSGADCFVLELLNQVLNSLSSPDQGSICDVMAGRIGDIWSRYNMIVKDREILTRPSELEDGATRMGAARYVVETSSFLTDPEVFGRDKVKKEIIEFLKTPAEELSVLAVVGIGGLGKTTLAQLVYNDKKVGDHFHPTIWVHVSRDFDEKKVLRQILEHVAGPQSSSHQMENLDVLQMTVANMLKDKLFLLVLDDLWFEDRMDNLKSWERLCASLIGGGKGKGCKILLTTRSAPAIGIKQPMKMVELDSLEFEDSWSLFKKHALPHGNSGRHSSVEDIGKRIVKKLNGVPLAVVTIGSMLFSKPEESEWTSVLENELWELEQGEGGVLPALRLSYEHLPPHLKPCFAYFSIFPKGYPFSKHNLVQLWMALGYTQPQGRKQMEDVGCENLNYLLNRSLVQCFDDKYVVHDLLHDLGRSILQDDYCVIETDQLHKISTEYQHQHHLSLLRKGPDLGELEKLQNFKKLRTLSFVVFHRAILQIPHSLFIHMTCLRVLDLSEVNIEILPSSISNLKHLRYLDLSRTLIKYLPESLCTLYMLQTLKLQGCDQLGSLPEGTGNLINLRYLEAKHELVTGISGIGKLVHLQELEVFSISEGDAIIIEDLKYMDELRGMLQIQNLQRVGSKEEATQAKLSNKRYINELKLEWIGNGDVNQRNSEAEEAILDTLVPPPRLKELTIKGYGGAKFPTWMKHHQSISRLESISLCRCQRWDALPLLIGWLPCLKTLAIIFFPQLKELPSLPTTLINLSLQDVGLNAISGLERLSLLRKMVLCNILDLRELPPLPSTLRILTIENLGIKALPEFYQVNGKVTEEGVDNNIPCLYKLKIAHCHNLRSLGGVLRHHLPYLSVLSIKECKGLVCWPEDEGFRATLLSLQDKLIIENCPGLMALPEGTVISPSLKKLIVKGCPGFLDRDFFVQMKNMKNLTQAGDVHVEQQYQDFSSCAEEALPQMMDVNVLVIEFTGPNVGGEFPFTTLVYDIIRVSLPRCLNLVSFRQLTLRINSSRESHDGEDYGCSSILSMCLNHHHLCSSLFTLWITNVPHDAFLSLQGREDAEPSLTALHLSSLKELVFLGCKGIKRLPVETLFCHLSQLKYLSISDFQELTLPLLEEGIKSLPSLELLRVFGCPKLSLPIPDAPACNSDDVEMPTRLGEGPLSSSSSWWSHSSSFSPASSSNPSSSPPLQLRILATDDVSLLANKQFARVYLSSLQELSIVASNIRSFLVAKQDYWLSSLRTLGFIRCPNMQELPPDFKSLFPSLEVLWILDCPRLRCIPERGLPTSLEVLTITRSPRLEVEDWPKVAHVRLIVMDSERVQGSFSDYQEMVAKEKIVPLNL